MFQGNDLILRCAIGALISAIGGLFFLYLIKKKVTETSAGLRPDLPGIAERALVTVFTVLGGPYLWLIVPVILIKGAVLVLGLSGLTGLLSREEPSLAYQKVKLKENLGVDLILSPALAVLVGILSRP